MQEGVWLGSLVEYGRQLAEEEDVEIGLRQIMGDLGGHGKRGADFTSQAVGRVFNRHIHAQTQLLEMSPQERQEPHTIIGGSPLVTQQHCTVLTLCSVSSTSFKPHETLGRTERLMNLPKVTQQGRCRAGFQTQARTLNRSASLHTRWTGSLIHLFKM